MADADDEESHVNGHQLLEEAYAGAPAGRTWPQGANVAKKSSVPSLPALAAIPLWKKKLLEKSGAANHQAAKLVKESHAREEEARARLTHLRVQAQRRLARAQSEIALIETVESKRQAVAQVRAESRRLTGLDVVSRLAMTPDPTEEEVMQLSVLFNKQLAKHYGDEDTSFYKLFKESDLDGSQRISFNELEKLARHSLHMTTKQLPPARLDMLWKSMDADKSGYIDAGELSRFTKLGKPKTITKAHAARLALLAENERQHALERAAADRRQAKDVITKQMQAEPADKEQLDELSLLFAKALAKISTGHASVHKLFLKMDKNESGQVSIDEFRTMCREDLKLTPERGLPDEKLWSLWRALDQNENGFICAGEWGRFMRTHAAALPADLNTEQSGKVREAHEADRARKQKEWAELASRKANELASAMEEEASRLEALLAKASARLLKPRAALANSRSAPQMEPIRRRATPASAGASTAHDGDGEIDGPSGADIAPEDGKGGTADGGQRRPGSLSPQKSAKELKKLSFQIAQGGGTRKRTGAPGKAKASELPMLRSFAIEEGLL